MNSFGKHFKVSIFGESHGPAIGFVVDGMKPGIELSSESFKKDLSRRRPSGPYQTSRSEADEPHILSGVFNGYTTGSPITVVFQNTNTHSSDYDFLPETPRPGHADYPAHIKYGGFEDYRGGGHFSGRITACVVGAGTLAKKMLPSGLDIKAQVIEVGGVKQNWQELLEKAKQDGDSLGAVVECRISGLPVGVGEPFWNSLESMLSHAMFAIPGLRGIEFGDGFASAAMKGSEHNDAIGKDGPISNGAGGINGGLSNGGQIVFRLAFKPTASISKQQQSYNFKTQESTPLSIGGRHDVCFALRTPVIVEAMSAIVLADLL